MTISLIWKSMWENDISINKFTNIDEKFSNISKSYGTMDNYLDIKKSKLLKSKSSEKNNYEELEIKILTTNPIYKNLVDYIKKYNINLLYNLENLDLNLPLVITYDNQSVRNEKNESFVNFLKGLTHYKYNYIVCGINTKWDGWYGRYKTYIELLETIPSEQLLFVTDSRDVLVNDSSVEFVKKYNILTEKYNDKQKNKIIFGTEIGCCVNQMWHYSPGEVFTNKNENIDNIKNRIANKIISENNHNITNENNDRINIENLLDKIEIEENKSEYNNDSTFSLKRNNKIYPNGKEYPWEHWIKWNNVFKEKFIESNIKYKLNINDNKYPIIKLNFGMMVGSNQSILKMLKLFDMRPGEDDQHLASEFFYSRPEMVILDYTQILLSNTGYKHSFRKCTSKTMNNTHYNVNFNDHLNDHDEYIDMNVYTREDIPEQGIMYGFDIEYLKYFFTYDNIITFPCFIQSPGKDWNCYNELLYRLPYCDDKMCSYYYNLEQTQKYNIRDIIIHEYKNQSGNMNIEWILTNMLNPIYWSLNLYITRDLVNIINGEFSNTDTFVLLDSGNLMGYYRFSQLTNTYIMPWDDDFDLAWYSRGKFTNDLVEKFFKLVVKKGYEIFIYYKEKHFQYSASESDHFTIKINSENILQLPNLLVRYEIVLFNIYIPSNKYKEILKIFNMDLNYEEKYVDGKIKIPSVDIFMYEFDPTKKTFDYNKLFGAGYKISISENAIYPPKPIQYNKINMLVPNNIKATLDQLYIKTFIDKYNDFEIIKIKRHIGSEDKQNEINKFNELNISVKDSNIILITKIYNNFVNKYFEIINSNETIKKIISST